MRRGIETMVASLANELVKRDVNVSILTARATQEPLVKLSPQVRVRAFPTFRFFEFKTMVPFYALDLIREHYDVVIVFFADFGEGRAWQIAQPLTRSKMILYLTFPYESAPHRYRAYQHWGWDKQAARVLADAEYTARRGEEFFKRPVNVLPSGTDPDLFKPNPDQRVRMRARFGFTDQEIVLLNVAALEKRKGAWRVVQALPEILARCPNVRYLVLGEGPDLHALLARARELGVHEKVIIAGTTADLAAHYNAADIFVMLPDSEAGSVACLEAMASGLPVVVSAEGGFAEVVNESNGRMVDIGDQLSIINMISQLARDESQRKMLGTAGRRLIVEKLSWSQIAERFLGVLETVKNL